MDKLANGDWKKNGIHFKFYKYDNPASLLWHTRGVKDHWLMGLPWCQWKPVPAFCAANYTVSPSPSFHTHSWLARKALLVLYWIVVASCQPLAFLDLISSSCTLGWCFLPNSTYGKPKFCLFFLFVFCKLKKSYKYAAKINKWRV